MIIYNPSEMDIVRSILANAHFSDMTLEDCLALALNAEDLEGFDHAVNLYGMEGISPSDFEITGLNHISALFDN